MKFLIFLSLFIFALSCGKTENAFDELTPEEAANIAQRYAAQCTSDYTDDKREYLDASNALFGSSSLARGISWDYVFQGQGCTQNCNPNPSYRVTVWKSDANNAYFIITSKVPTVSYKFLKITIADNNDIITDLITKICSKQFTSSSFNSSNATSQTVTQNIVSTTDTQQVTDTFTYSTAYLAFFSTWAEVKKVEDIDPTNGNTVTQTINYEGKLTYAGTQTTAYALYSDYNDSITSYCFVKKDGAGGYTQPFDPTNNLDCASRTTVDVTKFNPTELCNTTTQCSF